MRELKFRQWLGNRFEYWGVGVNECTFVGPCSSGEFRADRTPHQQYTGLKDQNGVEIYEGDIVNIAQNGWATDEYRGVVVEYCGVRGYSPWNECSGQIDIDYLASAHIEDIEVIGNIHQNPELVNT